jgi:hypothetical protein
MDRVLQALLRTELRFFIRKVFTSVSPGETYLHNWHVDIRHARLGLFIKTMRTSFMSIGVASNIRTCAARSSVWRQSIARPPS